MDSLPMIFVEAKAKSTDVTISRSGGINIQIMHSSSHVVHVQVLCMCLRRLNWMRIVVF